MSEQESKKQTGKGILVISIIAIVVVAVLVGVIVFLLVKQSTPKEEKKREVLVTEDNVEEFLENLKQEDELLDDVAPGYYTVTMVLNWHFKTGNEASYDAYVENVEQNTNDVYFDVVLEDDESKILYSSPIIPRGGRLDGIKLDTVLDAGQYDAVCIYHLVDENQNTISEVRMSLDIVVEE